jgi:sodium-dependent dicarboxylate transporter 2/3/5
MRWLSEAWARLLACFVCAALVYSAAPATAALPSGLALFALIGGLWMTQALPLSITALLVPLLAAVTGVLTLPAALASFAHPVIFLFMGGFALAAALQHQGLDSALAMIVLRLASGRRPRAVALLFVLTASLSMWMNNTATAAMMLPLALGLLRETPGMDKGGAPVGTPEKTFVLLGLAYSASIGGIGTLVGSPPNAIAAAQAGISFGQWLVIGIPMVLLLLPLAIGALLLVLRPQLGGQVHVEPASIRWTPQRCATVVIFGLTTLGWMLSGQLSQALGIGGDADAVIAIAAIVALVACGAVDWPTIERQTHWGVLLLFGGGLALSAVMQTSGASAFLADGVVSALDGAATFWLVLGVVAFVVFLTELVSNTASAVLLVPVFVGVSQALGLAPQLLAAAIAVSASCAFMLPVATPPNAIVFATDEVAQSAMIRCGFVLNLLCIVVITSVVTLFIA